MAMNASSANVTAGGAGLAEAVARAPAAAGARVAVLDINEAGAQRAAAAINAETDAGHAIPRRCDITGTASVNAALDAATAAFGVPRTVMNIAGIGSAKRVITKDGAPAPLQDVERVICVNLIGTYTVIRLAAARLATQAPLADADHLGERGVVLCKASVAAFDGQVGHAAYSASKGGSVGMTLRLERDLAQRGIRVVTVAPGLFLTPLMKQLPEPVQQSLAASIPFPKRLGKPEEFASLALEVVRNSHLNGEVIQLDGASRMAPR